MKPETRSRSVEVTAFDAAGVKVTSRSPHEQAIRDAFDTGHPEAAIIILRSIPETPMRRILRKLTEKIFPKGK